MNLYKAYLLTKLVSRYYLTCNVPITGIKIEVCLILLSFASKGRPPAFLIFCLFLLDFDKDQSA